MQYCVKLDCTTTAPNICHGSQNSSVSSNCTNPQSIWWYLHMWYWYLMIWYSITFSAMLSFIFHFQKSISTSRINMVVLETTIKLKVATSIWTKISMSFHCILILKTNKWRIMSWVFGIWASQQILPIMSCCFKSVGWVLCIKWFALFALFETNLCIHF